MQKNFALGKNKYFLTQFFNSLTISVEQCYIEKIEAHYVGSFLNLSERVWQQKT